MKISKVILFIILAALLFGFYYLYIRIPIIAGYTAKCACTQKYVNGRSLDDTFEDFDVAALKLASLSADTQEKSVMGSVFGLRPTKAQYQKGYGCRLVVGEDESNLPKIIEPTSSSSTLAWPYGNTSIDTLAAGVDYAKLRSTMDSAFDSEDRTRSLLVVYKDQILAEAYEEGFDKDTPILGWSMTKSWTSALIGRMVQEGYLKTSDNKLFAEWQNDERKNITLDHLLTMTSGLDWIDDYSTVSDATKMLYMVEDIVKISKAAPLKHVPGTHWYYSSGTTNLLSGLMRQKLGSDSSYWQYVNRFFGDLNMSSAFIEPDERGNFVGSSFGYATTRDWAKFGLLYLHDGVWNGQRLLPEGWVDYTQTEVPSSDGIYGAQFWLNKRNMRYPDAPVDLYEASGYLGQKTIIIPSKELVIVRTGINSDFDFNTLIKDIITCLP